MHRHRRTFFGPVDRPSVYRALGDLAGDGLLESWSVDPPAGGSTRQVYGLTPAGVEQLDRWMGVLEDARCGLGHVLDRYADVRR